MRQLLAAAAMAVMAFGGSAHAQQPPPIEAYAANDQMTSVRISPNGERLAMLSSVEGEERVIIVTGIDGSGQRVLTATDQVGTSPLSVRWLNDEFLLVSFVERRPVNAGSFSANLPRYVVLKADGSRSYEMPASTQIVSIRPDDPEHILVALPTLRDDRFTARGRTGAADGMSFTIGLYRHHIERDRRNQVSVGEATTSGFVIDETGEPVIRYDNDSRANRIEFFVRNGSGWRTAYRSDYTVERYGRGNRARRIRADVGTPSGLTGDGLRVWMAALRVGDDLRQAYQFDPETGEITGPHFDTNGADFGGFLTDWRDNSVIGAYWDDGVPHYEYFDSPWRELQAQLEATFPGSVVQMTTWDASANRIVVHRELGGSAGAYYLFDRSAGSLSLIGRQRPDIPDEWVAEVLPVDYRARDGRSILAYVTLPPGRELENLPLIVLPHGGPQARDFYGFDPWAQILASRGYVVIQPQFRGSDGFGQSFIEAGHNEWGRAMQDDVSDTITYLSGQNIIDEDRVCIFGWSYGGYAALAGATLTPELYQCAIAGAPVSDIFEMMNWVEGREYGAAGGAVDYWTEYIGDWRRDTDRIRSVSPRQNISDRTPPILLVHGSEDTIVPVEQAQIMAQSLNEAGRPNEYVEIEGGPHVYVLMTPDHNRQLYEAMLSFLGRYNPAD
ncbi:alpha/beta fold hydrolase [Hyphobacterium sp. SN044]|uniref:S9 family peptidase n=1 Tax=Hyphobacterium sp. SN044 TaxID=2912575 RepID=UPI001F33C0BA|nr:alpha/beta fold hydrolase [Hyphobacterium sp. SN044]MCF8879685.1 alpha/beta fold hydrolase [Hyphobacterium sp. SN044]